MDSAFPFGKIHPVDKPPHQGLMTPVKNTLTVDFIMIYLLVALGGAIGSVSRYWLSTLIDARFDDAFPWGTLCVNVTGSIVIGFFANLTGPDGHYFGNVESRLFIMTGICGGFTTFSAFSLQTLNLLKDGDWVRASGYSLSSVLVCLVGVWMGHVAGGLINQSHGG